MGAPNYGHAKTRAIEGRVRSWRGHSRIRNIASGGAVSAEQTGTVVSCRLWKKMDKAKKLSVAKSGVKRRCMSMDATAVK